MRSTECSCHVRLCKVVKATLQVYAPIIVIGYSVANNDLSVSHSVSFSVTRSQYKVHPEGLLPTATLTSRGVDQVRLVGYK